MNHLTVETEDTFVSLLELSANNDIEGFKQFSERDPSSVDEIGLWYGRQKGSKQMVLENRTPLMVAATYGSVDVMKLILSLFEANVNRSCGLDKSTALHCAASGGSVNAVDVVKLLLEAGADLNAVDANGHRPVDVIVVPPKLQHMKIILKELLSTTGSVGEHTLRVSTVASNSDSPLLSSSPENGSPSSVSDSTSSPMNGKFNDHLPVSSAPEKKEYPVDPSLPDIKNSIYSTDEFRMYSFKVRPCSRAYSHDWTECPFAHPGENARRRDPRKFHYSCVPCPDFRKGACRRGDMCEYAHGVFECWLHPAQYRTRLCKDGTNCNRRVCFFAHLPEELRQSYISTGSSVHSPRAGSATAMDLAAAMSLLPGSPSSVSAMSPSPFTPPMSPSASISHSSMGWPQPNIPTLHLPGSNLQSSRLRSSLNARDISAGDYNLSTDFDVQQQQLLSELSYLSQQNMNSNSLSRTARPKNLNPSNLDDLFSTESSSPRFCDQSMASAVYSPTHKSAVLSQFQQQQQSILSPINTSFTPRNVDHHLLQASFSVPSPGRMSPSTRNVEPISPMGSRSSIFAQHEKQQQFRSQSSRDLMPGSSATVGSPAKTWSEWGSANGKLDWSVNASELGRLRRSSSFELGHNGEEPDLSWVQSLVKESSPLETKEKPATPVSNGAASSVEGSSLNTQAESVDHAVLGAWLKKMKLDQLVAR